MSQPHASSPSNRFVYSFGRDGVHSRSSSVDAQDGERCIPKPGRIRLISDAESFRVAFSPWVDHSKHGWSVGKQLRLGSECDVQYVQDDGSMYVRFAADGETMFVPQALMAEQLSVMSAKAAQRVSDIDTLRRMLELFDSTQGIDVFDCMSFEPNADARYFADNRTRCLLCALLQIVAPLAVGIYLVWVLCHQPYELSAWENVCRVTTGWERDHIIVKILNKILGVLILFYKYNYMETRSYELFDKPTYQLIRYGLTFDMVARPAWIGVGLVVNSIVLASCGLVSVIVVYVSENPMDLVLNSVALFFLVEVDNSLCDMYDFHQIRALVRGAITAYEQDSNIPVLKKTMSFATFKRYASKVLAFVKFFVFISPLYISVCK